MIQHTDKPPKADRDFLLKALKEDGQLLKRAAKTLQADREVVLVAVKAFGRALQYAAEPLQADREIVLAAVKRSCAISVRAPIQTWLLKHAPKSIKSDREIVFAAVKEDPGALNESSEELQQDEELRNIAGL